MGSTLRDALDAFSNGLVIEIANSGLVSVFSYSIGVVLEFDLLITQAQGLANRKL